MGLNAGNWASRLGIEPQDWDLGFKAGIWALRLGLGPQGWDLGLEAGIEPQKGEGHTEKKKKEEKFPLYVKA